MSNKGIKILQTPPAHGMSYIGVMLFTLLGVDKKAEELYALEQMKNKLNNKPYYRNGERW